MKTTNVLTRSATNGLSAGASARVSIVIFRPVSAEAGMTAHTIENA